MLEHRRQKKNYKYGEISLVFAFNGWAVVGGVMNKQDDNFSIHIRFKADLQPNAG